PMRPKSHVPAACSAIESSIVCGAAEVRYQAADSKPAPTADQCAAVVDGSSDTRLAATHRSRWTGPAGFFVPRFGSLRHEGSDHAPVVGQGVRLCCPSVWNEMTRGVDTKRPRRDGAWAEGRRNAAVRPPNQDPEDKGRSGRRFGYGPSCLGEVE